MQWLELGEFATARDGEPELLLLPEAKLAETRREVGRFARVTAEGLDEQHAVPLRLRLGPSTALPLLSEQDFARMSRGASAKANLKLRRLRARERLSLVDGWTSTLVVVTIFSALFALGAALLPVDRGAQEAKRTAQRVADVAPALRTLEGRATALHALQRTATRTQHALTAPARAHRNGTARDEHLAEWLEHGVGRSEAARGRQLQAAADLRGWRAKLQREAKEPTHGWRSRIGTAATLFATAAAVLGGIALARRASPGAARG
jgi:hypothetical protein